MNADDDIDRRLEELGRVIDSEDGLVEGVMQGIEAKQAPSAQGRAESSLLVRALAANRLAKVAAAAVVVIAAILAIKGLDGTEAWARVVRAFNRVDNIHIVKARISESGRVLEESESWIKDQRLFKAESDDLCIVNNGENILTLYKEHKIAHLRDTITAYWDYTPVILKVLRNGPGDGAGGADISVAELSQESAAGERVFAITDQRAKWRGKAWVDAASHLPLRIAGSRIENATGERFELRFDYEPISEQVFRAAIPAAYEELPRLVRQDVGDGDNALSGTVIDERGRAVAGADVYASYASHGRTDEGGAFALLAPAEDGSGSIGPADFPMFVRAFKANDPYKVAWTLIRHPEAGDYEGYLGGAELSSHFTISRRRGRKEGRAEDGPSIERTHQGVKLVIEDEDELARLIPGGPGEVFGEDISDDPMVRDIMLIMGPASVIRGRVTDSAGNPVADATVWVSELEIPLGKNRLFVESLGSEWKHRAFAVTNANGRYEIGNLPASWDKVELRVRDGDGFVGEASYQGQAGNVVEGCDIALTEGEEEGDEPDDDDEHYKRHGRPRLDEAPTRTWRTRPEPRSSEGGPD